MKGRTTAGNSTTVGNGPPSPQHRPLDKGAIFAPGDLIAARYRVVRVVGRGGCGDVFEAYDAEVGETVALKTLRPMLATSAVMMERFRREIQNARKVTHPNVCRIFDIGVETSQGFQRLFLTMEMLPGDSLERRLEVGPAYRTDQALPVIAQIASGLQAAHDAGVVHRDLKPANVMLLPAAQPGTPDRVVITDFGIALSEDQGDARLTRTGEIVGTPEYMAPEQAEAHAASPASDIYALGLVMFEMLTLRRPFEPASSAIGTLLRRRREAPRPLRRDLPGADPVWETTIARCLEREPGHRFPRASDVTLALGHATSSSGGDQRTAQTQRPDPAKVDTIV